MGSVVTFNPAQVPAFAKNRELSAAARAMMGGGATGKRLSIKGGVFRLVVDGKEVAKLEERYIDVVIVNAAPKIARTYYGDKKYDADSPSAPVCWSSNGDVPDPEVRKPQHENCAKCPMNIKGSGSNDSRACRFNQRLAVTLANDVEGDVLQLTVPAQSLFGKEEGENRPLQAYARWLGTQNIGPDMVVTRLKFDTDSESPKLFFKPMRWLTDDEHEICQKQGQSEDAIKAISLTVSQMDGVNEEAQDEEEQDEPPPPPPRVSKPKAKPKAQAVEADDAEEPVAEPARREKPAAAPATPKASLASVLADWDETDD